MKRIDYIIIAAIGIMAILIMYGVVRSQEHELSCQYQAVTKDCEVDNIGQVQVEQTKVVQQKVSFTLTEIDYYISVYEQRLGNVQAALKELYSLKDKIRKEAEKVKLKDGKHS